MFQGLQDPGDSSHLLYLCFTYAEIFVHISPIYLVAQVQRASGPPLFTSTAHTRCHQTGLTHLQNRSRACPVAPYYCLQPGFLQHPSLGISVSFPAPRVCSRSNHRDALRVNVRSCHFSAQNSPTAPSVTQAMFLVASHGALQDLLPTTSPRLTPPLPPLLLHWYTSFLSPRTYTLPFTHTVL